MSEEEMRDEYLMDMNAMLKAVLQLQAGLDALRDTLIAHGTNVCGMMMYARSQAGGAVGEDAEQHSDQEVAGD